MTDMVHPLFKVVRNPDENGPAAEKRNKKLARGRAGHQCEANTPDCDPGGTLVVHHKQGRRIPNAHALHRLLVVCEDCHLYIHAHPEESRERGWMGSRTVIEDSNPHLEFQAVSGVDGTDPDYADRYREWVAEMGAESAISDLEGTGR